MGDADPLRLEVYRIDDAMREGWSVLVTGRVRRVGPDELRQVEALRIQPWARGQRTVYLRLEPRELTGRRIQAKLERRRHVPGRIQAKGPIESCRSALGAPTIVADDQGKKHA